MSFTPYEKSISVAKNDTSHGKEPTQHSFHTGGTLQGMTENSSSRIFTNFLNQLVDVSEKIF